MLGRVTRPLRAQGGVRAGAILLVSSAAFAASSYLYNLLCIRWLGPKSYGEVAALTALSMIVFLPLLGVQTALAREVARLRGPAEAGVIGRLFRVSVRRTSLVVAGFGAALTVGASWLISPAIGAAAVGVLVLLAVIGSVLEGSQPGG